jgi:hypothetical protein
MSDVAPDARTQCWREWLKGYTYGQSRDRVEYAKGRVAGLPPDVASGVDGGGLPLARPQVAVAPMPTNAFVPPPNTVSEPRASVEPLAGADRDAGDVPGARCSDACEKKWTSCHASCKDHACAACDRAYRTCMPPCFRDDDQGHPARPHG